MQQPALTELTRNDGKPYSVISTVIGEGSGKIRLDDNFHTNLSKLNKGDRIKIIGVIALPRNENDGKITLITVPNWSLGRIRNNSYDSKAGSILNMFDFNTGHKRAPILLLDPNTGMPIRSK